MECAKGVLAHPLVMRAWGISMDWLDEKNKQRIVQELVPGKQITLAHIIASPDKIL